MSRYAMTTLLVSALALGSVVWAGSTLAPDRSPAEAQCLTPEQVRAAADRSRNGISLTCNEQVRQRSLQRQARP